ncbi:autotransporter assembly complex protein TamA [Croceicoccus marinus]|uniref:autotransporter assembly complex protein TamA n=1 Tax=Croceicoccus marinus TaxID=450378 RepID=UPI001FD37AEB|nr:BamA/TamA family outer membrane protein [Croceicoccus marinus]
MKADSEAYRFDAGAFSTIRIATWALLLTAGAAVALAPAAGAQSLDADPELEALIPDAAVANPEAWAMDTEAAATPVPEEADADADLTDTGFSIEWPEAEDFEVELQEIKIDPELEQLLSRESGRPAADLALPGMAERGGEGDRDEYELAETELSRRIVLSHPASFAEFGQFDEFIARFEGLSDIETLRDDDDNLAQLANRAEEDAALLSDMLAVYGFNDADVRQRVETPPAGEGSGESGAVVASDAQYVFTIDPGERYRYGEVALPGLEAAEDDFAALRDAFEIRAGDFIQEDRIVAERIDLGVAMGETGYAFAEVGQPDLLIDHASDEGDLTLPVTPGGQYRFGEVISSDPEFLSSRHLSEIAQFDAGEIYQASEVDDLRRAILSTGLVSSLSVTPREVAPPANGEPGTVAVDVALTPAPLRTIAGAVGYDTGRGIRTEVSWEHRNLFPPEGMLQLHAIAGTQEQLAGATFRRNNWHGRDRVLTLDVFASTIDRDAYEARTISGVARFEKLSTLLFQKVLAWSIGLELVATQEREGTLGGLTGPRETYFVAALPGEVIYDKSDDLLDPTRGWRVALFASPELSHTGGERSTYLRSWAEGRYYQPVSERLVVAGRARFGTIVGTDISNIAPSRRLYAGGGGSVRGYGYQEIGPKDDLGDPTGGLSLSEFSLEARYRTGLLDGAISIVPFIDAGTVANDSSPRLNGMQYGAGVGVRYHTNFGPLRFDVATPLNPRPDDGRIAVYISLGQAF